MEQAFAHFRAVWLEGPRVFDAEQQGSTLARMLEFLGSSSQVFQRSHPPGHFTGSALVVDAKLEKVALTLHKKLGRWLQFGGHADGEPCLDKVALQEGLEESGLERLEFVPYEAVMGFTWERVPFDLDIHPIPAWKEVPPHFHYDVVYLLRPNEGLDLKTSHESEAVSWFTLKEARELCLEQNLQRQFDKLDWLRPKLSARCLV
jgi:hypothetical protein